MFPDQVRAMVLDSAFERTGDTSTEQWVTQLVGFEGAFDNWAAWCEAGADCAFTDVDVGARWDALIAALDEDPAKSDGGRPVNQVVMDLGHDLGAVHRQRVAGCSALRSPTPRPATARPCWRSPTTTTAARTTAPSTPCASPDR